MMTGVRRTLSTKLSTVWTSEGVLDIALELVFTASSYNRRQSYCRRTGSVKHLLQRLVVYVFMP